jgi:hypothetical protein
VVDAIEAQCRTLMAKRASLPNDWLHRAERRELTVTIDAMLERWNWLSVGR